MNFHLQFLICIVALSQLVVAPLEAQVPSSAVELRSEQIQGAKVFREKNQVWITPTSPGESRSVHIPRFCAPIHTIGWVGEKVEVSLAPEIESWAVSWKKAPVTAKTILITFDSDAVLPIELKPAIPAGDGSISLPAFQATTKGQKLRFEPQPYKNTVGYWVVPTDTASWSFTTSTGGSYAIGLLQGCGEGQGGSQARLEFSLEGQIVATKDLTAVDTGHFQNFRWLHLGQIELPREGNYQVTLRPTKIAKAALFDVRAIQLVKQAKKID